MGENINRSTRHKNRSYQESNMPAFSQRQANTEKSADQQKMLENQQQIDAEISNSAVERKAAVKKRPIEDSREQEWKPGAKAIQRWPVQDR
jgi:hypothetical protein